MQFLLRVQPEIDTVALWLPRRLPFLERGNSNRVYRYLFDRDLSDRNGGRSLDEFRYGRMRSATGAPLSRAERGSR